MPDANGQATIDDFTAEAPTTVKRFVYSIEPHDFYLNDDHYQAVAVLPLGTIAAVAGLQMKADTETIDKILSFMDTVLLDEFTAKFRENCFSKTKPIGMPQVMDIINWLLEIYGLRPTKPSADSSDTSASADGSTPSTDGASPEA